MNLINRNLITLKCNKNTPKTIYKYDTSIDKKN